MFITYITVNMHQREEDVSLMKPFMTKNVGAGPGSTKPGCQTGKKNAANRPRDKTSSLNDKALKTVDFRTSMLKSILISYFSLFQYRGS